MSLESSYQVANRAKSDSIATAAKRNEARASRSNQSYIRVDSGVPTGSSIEQVDNILNRIGEKDIDKDAFQSLMHDLFGELNRLRLSQMGEQWQTTIDRVRQHSNFPLIHEDPFTQRAFNKPRGYAGDAVMMDYIYSLEDADKLPEASDVGRQVFNYTASAPAADGVRARREQMARLIDEQLCAKPNQRVLVVASGHLREAECCPAIRRGKFAQYIASDADEDSLESIDRDYGRYGIETQKIDIRKLLTGRCEIEGFDLIYTTGLYDYLNDRTGNALTKRLFDALSPGGRLVVANFLPTIRDIGYMESCMDWFLIYRDRAAMAQLVSEIDQSQIGKMKIWAEENQNVVFLDVAKIG